MLASPCTHANQQVRQIVLLAPQSASEPTCTAHAPTLWSSRVIRRMRLVTVCIPHVQLATDLSHAVTVIGKLTSTHLIRLSIVGTRVSGGVGPSGASAMGAPSGDDMPAAGLTGDRFLQPRGRATRVIHCGTGGRGGLPGRLEDDPTGGSSCNCPPHGLWVQLRPLLLDPLPNESIHFRVGNYRTPRRQSSKVVWEGKIG
jgi:hypothetical protein